MQLDYNAPRLSKYALELKYVLVASGLLLLLFALSLLNVLSMFEHSVLQLLQGAQALGIPGMFLLALVANATLIIQIPYTWPIISAVLHGADLNTLILLGLIAGIGAGLAKIISYTLADKLLATQPHLADTWLFKTIQHLVATHPRTTPLLIFCMTALPLPDDAVIIPLAMIRYGLRRFFLPAFLGKVVHNICLALMLYFFTDLVTRHISQETRSALGWGLMVILLTLMFYQLEKIKRGRLTQHR